MDIRQIVDLSSAFYGSSVLFAVVELNVCGAIRDTPDPTAERLADVLGTSPRGTRLLLDAAVAIGLLTKDDAGCYGLTDGVVQALVPGAPHDLTKAILYNRDVMPAWSRLVQLARTGAPVERPTLHLGDDEGRTRRFAMAMHGRAMGIGTMVIPALGLPKGARVLDLAGGPGTYALLMAKQYPSLTVDTWDVPAISAIAKEITAPCGDRIACHAGDYHTDVYPAEHYDAVTLFGCLHQESPEAIVSILRRAADALRPGGKVYVLDMMTDASHTKPAFSALFAVNMALTTDNGWVFSQSELDGWLAEAGFGPAEFSPAPPPMPHILAKATKRA